MKRFLAKSLLPLLLIALLPGCLGQKPPRSAPSKAFSNSPYVDLESLKEGAILHIPTGMEVDQEGLFRVIGNSRIIYVGEAHTNTFDHAVQMEIIKGLWKRFPGEIAVGMEMFQRPAQSVLDRWSGGSLDEKTFLKTWYTNWEQDFAYYKEILYFIRDKKIPLIALNAPRDLVQESMGKGIENLPDEMKSRLPEMDPDDPFHKKSVAAVFGGHGHGNEGFDSFYKTMLIWDETMAESVSNYLSSPAGSGKKMVVLAGGFHVNYGFGIPRRVFRRLTEPYSIVLPFTPVIPKEHTGIVMNVKPVEIPLYLADFVWAVGYDDLENKGVRLGVQIDRDPGGVRVIGVVPESNAARHGIEKDDVIFRFNDEPVTEPFELGHLVRQLGEGDKATILLKRGEEEKTVEVEFKSH